MTPIMNARGKWELLAPWAVVDNVAYKCDAIRSFRDLQGEGIDIFATYYQPMGLSADIYNSDRVNGTSLITLISDDHPQITVPSTYIKTAPTTVTTGFNRMVMGIDIGILPDALDISYLNAEIKGLVSALTGLDSTVTTYTAPITGLLTPEQAESFEVNRQSAIEKRATFYSKVETLQQQLTAMTAIKDRYEKIIIDHQLSTS